MDAVATHRPRSDRCAIAIMAKAPAAGRVKTRLASVLNLEEANALARCFLRDMTANLALAAETAAIDPFVAFAPAGSEAAFDGAIEPGTEFVLADGNMAAPPGILGLGICLFQAACGLLGRGYGAVALLNSDSPTLPTRSLIEAARLLAAPEARTVLGPTFDGGYYLIGMKAPHPELFQAIDWSTALVAKQTRARAAERGLAVVEIAPWYDVDDAASLHRLLAEFDDRSRAEPCGYAAPETRRFLETNRIAERLAIQTADASR